MRLEQGSVYELDGRPYRCELVNACRARLVPAWKETRTIETRDGTSRTIHYTPKGLDVSPHSALRRYRK